MSKHIDLNIYVKELQDDDRQNLVSVLASQAGVISTRMNEYIQRLVTIEYDPEQVQSKRLITTIAQHGYQGRLIGI